MQNEPTPGARGPVFCGVDTHADSHWLCVLDWRGRKVLSRQFPADAAGYEALAGAIAAAGEPACVAMEGTSSYGAGLTRHLASLGMPVREALSPARTQRRRPGQGKCDEADAERAARAAMSGSRLGTPKSQDGWVDGVRCMLAARSGAVKARTSAINTARSLLDWQHLFGRFREGQPRLPELDRRHVAQRRVDPEVVVPVHVVRELGPELARRAERLAVDELGLQYPVGRLVDGVVVGAALGRQRPLNAEGLEHQVDLGVVELAAAVRVEDLDVRDGEGERRERRLDQPGVRPGPGGVADDLPVVEVDEQADVVPRGPDAHVGQVAAYMGARRPAAEAARDDVGHVGLVDRPGVHLEPLPAVCADQAVLPHDAADPAPADGDARPLERRLYLARAVPALAGGVGRDHGRRGGVRRGGPVGPRAHGVVRRPRDAEEPALR